MLDCKFMEELWILCMYPMTGGNHPYIRFWKGSNNCFVVLILYVMRLATTYESGRTHVRLVSINIFPGG